MSTYVSQMEESGGFSPVSSWLCTSHMLSPPLLTSARQTELIYPGAVGGCIDDERLMSVLSFLIGWGAVVFLVLTRKSGKSKGSGQGIKTFSGEQGVGAAGRITWGRCSAFPGWEVLFHWEGDLSCMRRAERELTALQTSAKSPAPC